MKRERQKNWLSFLIIALTAISCQPKKKTEGEPLTHYLFAYFTSNETTGQQVCYAVSENGLDFTPINGGRPVIASDTISRSGGVRDPHLLRAEDGSILLSLTDMDWQLGKWTCRGIVLMKSDDLIHWQHSTVHFPERFKGEEFALADAVWAPQTIYDPTAQKYMVYFSLHSPKDGPFPQDAVFYAYANPSFTDLEGSPKRLFRYDGPSIDTDIVRDEAGLYHIFFNTWGGGLQGTGRRKFTATELTDTATWTLAEGLMKPEGVTMKSEGSSAYPLNDGSAWVLAYDCYADGVFHFCTSTDLTHFTLVRETKTEGNFTPRHGSILPITTREYERLTNYYN
ncbi:MAG: glycoside hydrolase family 43 protein [Bacteroidaceae bacterium]|nr:glycoside hydrolase family 43 protein [Bacteroidaceae bacterium]